MSYLIVGGSGAPNYGDEIILKLWLDLLGEQKNTLRVESNIKNNTIRLHGDREKVEYSDFIKNVAKNKTSLGFWNQVKRGVNFFDRNGIKIYGEKNFNFLNGLKVVHLHGGGYINKNAELNGFVLGFCYALHKETGARLIGTGLGLHPISSPPNNILTMASEVFQAFYGIELRDKESFDFANLITNGKANAVFGYDDVYLQSRESFISASEKRRLVLSFSKHNVDKFTSSYWKEVSKFKEKFDEVVFWECFPWQDRSVFDLVCSNLTNVNKVSVEDSVYGNQGFSENDFLITSRFHPHLISSRVGAAGLYYSDSQYYNVKHGSVVACGSKFLKGDFSQFNPSGCRRSELAIDLDEVHVMKKKRIAKNFLDGICKL
ncbi:polysaccharide pyruvyl transferase family protein [Halomonas binhaiensis]|uniref:Polysaccharide pyruvyl transferase family protein n=1 Tax=Halomonas binhaiensis TaxID=2562282 RepID=A0A5C1NIC4_9GAMM|nr:polysaccharide pyruvyl transferase family protein [Halomonas binhaiensis]QEM82178.1 polysaccharide pyruvyl transferase family protein [Halomonas binhaiensis]